jgi:protein TonB
LATKGRFAFVLLICFLIHAIPIWLFVYLDRSDDLAPGEQEIPVEIIVEPPPPKAPEPAAPKNDQQAKQATLNEKMATDAPRAPNDEKVMRDSRDEASHAPKAAPDTVPARTKPANGTARNSENTTSSKPAEASAPQLMDHRADGDPAKAAELQRPDTQEQTKAEQAAPEPETQQKASQDPWASFTSMPDYSFAPASRHAPTTIGKAASTYLSILYGMVMARIHLSEVAAGRAQTIGKITFSVDFSGRLIQERVVKSSGSPELDSAAMAAIRAAAPFPPSPTGTGLSLNFHYGK